MIRLTLASLVAMAATTLTASASDFKLEDYFTGVTHAKGSFSAINGVKRVFDVRLKGKFNGELLTLVEDFAYSDGERDRKTWKFTKTGPGRYTGTREDVIGSTTVRISGNTAKFTYLVDLDAGPGQNIVRFYDTMILSADGKTVKNRALVTKYGVPVAKVKVDFTR
jgi:Protein of unknown function (DUF3833)